MVRSKIRTGAYPVPRANSKQETPFDTSRIGRARREAIRRLDEFGCTVAEQRAAFGGITKTKFHRWAHHARLRRRPVKREPPGCRYVDPDPHQSTLAATSLRAVKAAQRQERHEETRAALEDPDIPASDGLEIAVWALLRSDQGYRLVEIAEALNTSTSTVSRIKNAPAAAENRWHHRHIPSHAQLSPAELERDQQRRYRRWRRGHRAE